MKHWIAPLLACALAPAACAQEFNPVGGERPAFDVMHGEQVYSKQGGKPIPLPPKEWFARPLEGEIVPGVVYVRFRPDVPKRAQDALHQYVGIEGVEADFSRYVPGLMRMRVPIGQERAAILFYLADSRTLYAEPLRPNVPTSVPNDPRWSDLWGMDRIRAQDAWDIGQGDANFKIAVVDVGVDITHPDLWPNIWTNPGEIAGNGIDDDGNGYIDDVHGWNTCAHNGDISPLNGVDHGTHVSGTIGAVGNNGLGVVGVNWRCKIVSITFCDTIEALAYCYANGIKVSNHSYKCDGSPAACYNASLADMIQAGQQYGHVFVAAAGNDGTNNDYSAIYPASYPADNLISVANHEDDNRLRSSSNYGAVTVDLAAPGADILSTVFGADYATKSGTSMSSPHVAGVAALVYSRFPTLQWWEVRNRILSGVVTHSWLSGFVATGGRLDAARPMGVVVRYSFSGSEQGTSSQPYNTLAEALPWVPNDGHLFIWATTLNWTGDLRQSLYVTTSGGEVTIH